jgi:hypothetical protein
MHWQYRTIVFEFQKDGLLGDRFIDDEDVEKTLNEQGREGWELVSATMVQDGLLTLLKRPLDESVDTMQQASSEPLEPVIADPVVPEPSGTGKEEDIDIRQIQEQEREHIRTLQEQRAKAVREEQKRLFGEIRIR